MENDFKKSRPIFNQKIWQTIAIFFALVLTFGCYVYTERQIDRAHQLRHISYQLADQLRQSSDDQTRMARTYAVTEDLRYKKYYQDLLDIRNGKKPRPKGDFYAYRDVEARDTHAPRAENGQAIALLDLMRQSGFTENELGLLTEAKANLDDLTTLEFEAMKLVQSAGSNAETNRAKALLMLHDENYHQAKAKFMVPVSAFYALMEKRTLAGIHHARNIALIFRLIFIATALGSIFMFWRAYTALRTKSGALPELCHQLEQSQLITMLTHELKTPLAAIKLAAGALGSNKPDGNKSAEADYTSLGHIGLAVRDMDAMIDRCIQADKVDQGVLHINTSRFLLAPCVNDIAQNLGALSRLEVNIPASLLMTGDDMLVRIILGNLLENAFKYSPPDSRVSIYATPHLSEADRSGVMIRVCNEIGRAGRPDEARVFEKYYRNTAAQRQRGVGLGLWLVKSIAAQLGGQVKYVSLHEKVEFQVWLPQ